MMDKKISKRHSFKNFILFFKLILPLSWLLLLTGCAKGPFPVAGPGGGAARYLAFTLTVNRAGVIDRSGIGYYAILFNSRNEPIDVTIDDPNTSTYTDKIIFNGVNFLWYHRQENVPPPGYTWFPAGSVNNNGSVSSDGRSLIIKFNINDSSTLLAQYLQSSNFTVHVVTLDNQGRPLDTIGPTLDNSIQYTMKVNKLTGYITGDPIYPNDNENDYVTRPDLPADYPYKNFDIVTFQITTQ
ncbi:MAG: hypothetical protein M1536_09250 [Firmicutes bacterium]|nr:hypothetical protein [Bacillota bacterium]